jgi:GTP-binding protein HflX
VKSVEKLLKRRLHAETPVTQDFATQLTFLSEELRRVVAVLVNRQGYIEHVIIGDVERVYLPDLGRQRAGQGRFRGLRLIRTALRTGGDGKKVELSSDDLTDLSKLKLDMVIAVAVSPGGYPGPTAWAHLVPQNPEDKLWEVHHAAHPKELEDLDLTRFITELEGEFQRKTTRTFSTSGTPAMLIYVAVPGRRREEVELAEMMELCRTAGVEIVETLVQHRQELHPKYAIGRGKLEDLTQRALQRDVDLLIFGQDLNPGQLRNITMDTELRVIDRTQLILDIFAQHATSAEGKIQVELAQLKYNLPRLSDRHTGMSRLTGGIGGRGPGETKLEINRRRARERVRALEQEIARLSQQRELRRQDRHRNKIPNVGIVGYTNAGKSTLLNSLTQSDVLSEDKLFATLRPTSRKLWLGPGREIVVTDTVGFIHDLPQDLVNAFKSTLEELADADVLLHVVDISDDDYWDRMTAVRRILGELGLQSKPELLAFNKSDRLSPEIAQTIAQRFGAVPISALDKSTLGPLVEALELRLIVAGKLGERAATAPVQLNEDASAGSGDEV